MLVRHYNPAQPRRAGRRWSSSHQKVSWQSPVGQWKKSWLFRVGIWRSIYYPCYMGIRAKPQPGFNGILRCFLFLFCFSIALVFSQTPNVRRYDWTPQKFYPNDQTWAGVWKTRELWESACYTFLELVPIVMGGWELRIPLDPCMVYSPTFTIKINQM